MKGKYFVLAMVPVLFLSGCKWFGGGEAKNEEMAVAAPAFDTAKDLPQGVLAVWEDGTPLLTQKEFDETLDMAMKEQPELQGLAEAFMPMLKKQLFNTLIQHKIIAKWIEDNKVADSKDYKDKVEQIIKAITQKVNVDFFAKEFEYTPSAKDVKEYFDKNKDRVALVTKGGIKAMGVKFDNEADANAFLAKAKAKPADFEKLVEADEKLKDNIEDFFYVNAESRQLAKPLKDAIMVLKSFPQVMMIKADDKTFWVVSATEKKEAEYRTFDEMKEQLENVVKQTKQGEAIMAKLQELQKKYGVKIKEDAFMPPKKPVPADMMQAPKEDEGDAEKAPAKRTKAA